MWEKYNEFSGIAEEDFFQYYHGKDNGFAIEICGLEVFDDPIDPKEVFDNFVPPQSFRYFEEEVDEQLIIEHYHKFSSK